MWFDISYSITKGKTFPSLEGKIYKNNFQEHDLLQDLKIPPFSSLLRSTGEKGGNFKYRKESCSWKLI